ncbi:Ig-like domain-containing protein [Paenibacillus algorifonticola]|uniref:Ig-like domain-containing protein n=1 Tax=Paenibacillus algorifonticola TaxID=684063 RepID=UPI003D2A1A67
MNDNWRKMTALSLKKGPSLFVCAAVLGTTLSLSAPAYAIPEPSNYFLPVVNNDLHWVKNDSNANAGMGSTINVYGSYFSLDSQKLFPPSTVITMLTATSSDTSVASANAYLPNLEMEIFGPGTTEIRVEGVTSENEKLTEHFRVTVDLFADTNKDGIITSADAFHIVRELSRNSTLTPGHFNLYDIDRDRSVTAADASTLMDLYTGKTVPDSSKKYIVTLSAIDDAPAIYNGSLSADTWAPGQTVTAEYSYFDPENDFEGNTRFKWFRGLQADGSNRTEIISATSNSYTLQQTDLNYYVFAEVTPVAASGDLLTGETVLLKSNATVASAAPFIVSRTPIHGSVNVNQYDDIVFTFDRDISAVAGKEIKFIDTSTNSEVLSFPADYPAHVIISGNTVTISGLTMFLPSDTQFSIIIDDGAFEDIDGVDFAGTAFAEWVFTTQYAG